MFSKYSIRNLLSTACLTFGLAVASAHAAEISTHQHEHGTASVELSLNNGKKWVTDEALRKGMQNIRAAMQPSLHDIHGGKFSDTQYNGLAGKISNEISYVVANCKLEPQADAQLHIIIAEIMDGVDAMEGKVKKVNRQAGAVKVMNALDDYAAYFHHPGWRPLIH
jgi:hypothetical protein